MKNKAVFNALVKNGHVTIIQRQEMVEWMRSQEGRLSIVISKHRPIRSKDQNKLWWFLMTWAGDELGYTKDEMHDTFKAMFLTDRSSGIPVVRSTTTLTTEDWSKLYEQVVRTLSEAGLVVPSKDDLLALTF